MVRFGSTATTEELNTNNRRKIQAEVNTVEAVKTSANKFAMKAAFAEADVRTCNYSEGCRGDLEFPLVAKRKYGSRGEGMVYLEDVSDYEEFLGEGNTTKSGYIFEEYFNGVREYRLHITEEGCFYTCRKMLKSDTPEDDRFFRNDSNSVWFLEDNEKFDKPVNWDEIVAECVKALKAVGLDVGACDVRVQSATNKDGKKRENPDFRIIEINSAPSFGDVTAEKYKEMLPRLICIKLSKNVSVDA